jgi:hypothetical protein
MNKASQWFEAVCLFILFLVAGTYILFLRDKCDIQKDKCHVQSLQKVGYRYRSILEGFKTQKGQYPSSLEELTLILWHQSMIAD